MDNAAYRIIDANFNRAREALRMIEDFCRFAINSESLSARAKQQRHKLCSIIKKLDSDRLISSRDTLADVGVSITVADQHKRGSLKDCFTAGSKRLHEALRVLSEVIQVQDSSIAVEIEKLRYDSYTLEKDIVLISDPYEKFRKVELYIIITSNFPSEILSLANQCAAGGADCIQLRVKDMPDEELFAVSDEFVKICKSNGVYSVINDRTDIAIASDADGVHLGQGDLPVTKARQMQLKPMIIGKSTHSLEQLQKALEENPAYVGLGPVFATPTKPSASPVSLEYVTKAAEILSNSSVGHVAIGGITLDNVEMVLDAGAECVAVCRAVTNSPNPQKACREIKDKISAYKNNKNS